MKWCEKCKDYVVCTLKDKKPKCFTPITNTAHGTPESLLAKALRFSRDNHEIAEQTENSSEKPNNCEDKPQTCENRKCKNYDTINDHCMFIEQCHYEPKDEPQTDCPWK